MNSTATLPAQFALLPLPQEEQARADLYALIAGLLLMPPDTALLEDLSAAGPLTDRPDEPLDVAWAALRTAAGRAATEPDAFHDEYDTLFVGVGTPQINPYGSLYLAGFMMEKPLMILRNDLADLGLERSTGSGELEDHLGALCETMRLIITGEAGNARQPIQRQKAFFQRHIASWYERCLADIRAQKEARFYRAAADFIEAFFDIEKQAFDIETAGDKPDTPCRTALHERL